MKYILIDFLRFLTLIYIYLKIVIPNKKFYLTNRFLYNYRLAPPHPHDGFLFIYICFKFPNDKEEEGVIFLNIELLDNVVLVVVLLVVKNILIF